MNRPPQIRAAFDGELIVDNFAGGGGASTGIEAALGRPVDLAINHSPRAIAMHAANHPETRHILTDITEVDPREACGGRPVGLAWFSPDCRHFSRAKGTAPVSKKIRGLAWVVVRWAKTVRPRVIILENVEEFQTWGPLGPDGRPDAARTGETFREWISALSDLGYKIDFRPLVAADHGAPTTRRRLFMIARCDGGPLAWPVATHGVGRAEAWRPAAEIIDWSLPCRSIFDPTRPKPLAEATLRRIAAGIDRYVIRAAQPFLIPLTHGRRGDGRADYRVHDIGEPVRTITGANRGEFAIVNPYVVRHGHYSTITGAGLEPGCAPRRAGGGAPGTFRGQPLGAPLATVCATNDKHLVVPVVVKHYGGVVGHDARRTLGTVTARDHHALAAAFLTKFYGSARAGASAFAPLPTVTAGGERGGGHLAEVRAFLVKYYGTGGGAALTDPVHTITTRDRFGLVTVAGVDYQIVDIGMRMLQPHELFAAQGFPGSYDLEPHLPSGKRITKTDQIALAGNSVCPPVARAVVSSVAMAAA